MTRVTDRRGALWLIGVPVFAVHFCVFGMACVAAHVRLLLVAVLQSVL